jgi:hypothetical protein
LPIKILLLTVTGFDTRRQTAIRQVLITARFAADEITPP